MYWDNNINWAAWQTHADSHGINADPLFVNAAGGNFRLQAGSPCIDKGIDMGLSEDYFGSTVPQGLGVDIGAYEYISGSERLRIQIASP